MEKKKYVAPAVLSVSLSAEAPLLSASNPHIGVDNGSGPVDAGTSYSNGRGGWNSDLWSSVDE